MTKVFLNISGRENAFIPTAGVMALAIKSDSWESFYKGQHEDVHVFTWSPRQTHMLESMVASDSEATEYTSQTVRGAGLWLPDS